MGDDDRKVVVSVEERKMSEGRQNDKPEPVESTDEKIRPEGKGVTGAGDPEKSSLIDVDVDEDKDDFKMTPETLQQLILERKAERKRKAEEKRLEGLTRIAEMKSGHGMHPIDDLFPEEIWIKILKDLNPMDRYNMRQVHLVFKDLMEDTSIQNILLPLVLDHNIPLLQMLLSSLDGKTKRLQQIQILRHVSKGVRDGVDKHIEEHLLYSLKNSSQDEDIFFHSVELDMYSRNGNMLSIAFTTGPIPERANRFFLKSLKVHISPDGGRGHYEENCRRFPELFSNFKAITTELLKKVGDQILYFDMSFGNSIHGIVDIGGVPMSQISYGLIREWLTLMSNLKGFCLSIFPCYSNVRQHPPMPVLKELEGVFMWQEMTPEIDAVLAANPHVKYIVGRWSSDDVPYTHPTVLRLPLEAIEWNFPSLRQITDSNWKVKKMNLWMNEGISLNEVFQCLQQNFSALEQLSLHSGGVGGITIGKDLNYLRLPNLREFKLDLGLRLHFTGDFNFFFALYFLVHCSKLESLSWTNSFYQDDLLKIGFEQFDIKSSKRLIDFQCEGGIVWMDMKKSNIWDVFPQLKSIKVNFGIKYWYSINERRGALHGVGEARKLN